MTNSVTTGSKLKWIGVGTSTLLVGAVLSGCGGNNASTDNTAATTPTTTAPDTATSNSAMSNSTSGTSSTGSTGTTASTTSFTEAAATWKQVTEAKSALDNLIKSKKLSTVHEAAFKVRDLVKKLPSQSSGLGADKQKSLATQVKNVEQLAGLLDKAGDSNNLQDAQDNLVGLGDALDTIKGLYPADSLK